MPPVYRSVPPVTNMVFVLRLALKKRPRAVVGRTDTGTIPSKLILREKLLADQGVQRLAKSYVCKIIAKNNSGEKTYMMFLRAASPRAGYSAFVLFPVARPYRSWYTR